MWTLLYTSYSLGSTSFFSPPWDSLFRRVKWNLPSFGRSSQLDDVKLGKASVGARNSLTSPAHFCTLVFLHSIFQVSLCFYSFHILFEFFFCLCLWGILLSSFSFTWLPHTHPVTVSRFTRPVRRNTMSQVGCSSAVPLPLLQSAIIGSYSIWSSGVLSESKPDDPTG